MRPTTTAGIAGVVLGFLAILDRGIAGVVELDYLVVTAIGGVAGAIGAFHVNRRRELDRKSTAFDEPERRYRADVPSADLDARFGHIGVGGGRRTSGRALSRLREAAASALVAHAGYDRADAETAVANGTWTDATVAAAFLADPSRVPRTVRLKALIGRSNPTETCVRRSVEAIATVIEP